MDVSINIPFSHRIVFQLRIQKMSAPRKSKDPVKAAARQTLNHTLSREMNENEERFYLL